MLHYVQLLDTGAAFDGVQQFHTVDIDNRIRPIPAFINLFAAQSYITSRFQSVAFELKLIQLLQESTFDIIHLDGLSSCLYTEVIRKYSMAKVVYRAHNVEYKLWERAAIASSNPLKRWYINIQATRLKTFERNAIATVDTVLSISQEDEIFLKQLSPQVKTYLFPAGMIIDETIVPTLPQSVSLFFIGALDWLPNLQGLDWFLNEVWGVIHKRFPSLQFHIAGKKMPAHFHTLAHLNIIAHGEVPSAVDFMNQHTVLLSPLISGSGVRIKIIEAMALGKVVLTTTVSAEGSGAEDGKHLLIANTTDEFIHQIERLLDSPALLQTIAQNARNFAIDHFQNKRVITKLLTYYKSLQA